MLKRSSSYFYQFFSILGIQFRQILKLTASIRSKRSSSSSSTSSTSSSSSLRVDPVDKSQTGKEQRRLHMGKDAYPSCIIHTLDGGHVSTTVHTVEVDSLLIERTSCLRCHGSEDTVHMVIFHVLVVVDV